VGDGRVLLPVRERRVASGGQAPQRRRPVMTRRERADGAVAVADDTRTGGGGATP